MSGGLLLASSQTPTWLLAHSSPFSGRGEKIGRRGTRKLVGQDEDREIIYQLPLQAKQTSPGEINYIYCYIKYIFWFMENKKTNIKTTAFLFPFPKLDFTPSLETPVIPPRRCSGGWGEGVCLQWVYNNFSLPLLPSQTFLLFQVGSLLVAVPLELSVCSSTSPLWTTGESLL